MFDVTIVSMVARTHMERERVGRLERAASECVASKQDATTNVQESLLLRRVLVFRVGLLWHARDGA